MKRSRKVAKKDEVWDVHVVSSIHQDLGYMNSSETDKELYAQAYREYIEIMEKDPRPTYSSEFAYTVRWFVKNYPEWKERLAKLIKAGRFGVGAQCSGFDPSFYSGEFIARMIACAKLWLKENFGYEPRWNQHADVPDFTPQIAQIYKKCEIDLFVYDRLGGEDASAPEYPGFWEKQNDWLIRKYFEKWGYDSEGNSNAVYPGYWSWKHEHPLEKPASRLWYYTGLDGTKTLAYYPEGRYVGFYNLQLTGQEQEKRKFSGLPVEAVLSHLNDEVDPVRTCMGISGFDEEITRIDVVADNCDKWNKEKGDKMNINLHPSTIDAFTAKIAKAVAEGKVEPDSFTGFAPGWGYEGPHTEEWNLIENGIPVAEELASLNALLGVSPYPEKELEEAWYILWMVSHNQRATPEHFKTVKESAKITERLLNTQMKSLASNVKASREDPGIVVFNPMNWQRSGPVQATFHVRDIENRTMIDAKGKPVPTEILRVDKQPDGSTRVSLSFLAIDVPSVGYKTYYFAKSNMKPPTTDIKSGKNWIENTYYRVSVDEKGIINIYDKIAKREISDNAGRFKFAHLTAEVTRRGVTGPEVVMDAQEIKVKHDGDVSASIEVKGRTFRSLTEVTLTLYALTDRVDIRVDIDWVVGDSAARFYLALPFKMKKAKLRFGTAYGSVPYYKPTAHGILRNMDFSKRSPRIGFSSHWWLPVNQRGLGLSGFDWAYMLRWANVSDEENSVTIANSATRDGVCFKDNLFGLPLRVPINGSLHNYVQTIRSEHGKSWDDANAPMFGEEMAHPMLVASGPSAEGKLPEEASLLEVSPSNVILTAFKRTWDGKGYALRFYEATDRDTEVTIKLHPALGLDASKATSVNIMEREPAKLEFKNGLIHVPTKAFSIETIRLC